MPGRSSRTIHRISYTVRGGERGPVILVVFKTMARVLRGFGGGFDSHTLPPYLIEMTAVAKK